MMVMILRIKVAPIQRKEVLKLLRPIIGPTEAQANCLFCRIYSETEEDDDLLLIEEWRSEKAFERHIRSSEFKRILAAIDLGITAPKLSINRISDREGFERIESILSTR